MEITGIKTEKILPNTIILEDFLDKYIKKINDKSVLVFSSKIISILLGNIKKLEEEYEDLIIQEAEYISKSKNKYNKFITVKHSAFISGSGIDQSNGNGYIILLPEKPFEVAKTIYDYLKNKHNVDFGIIITDSHSTPLRRGAVGISIGFWGFSPLHDYVGEKDIFGREFCFEKANLVDQISSAANLIMGEGAEQTPVVIVNKLDILNYDNNLPTVEERKSFLLSPDEDLYHIFYQDRIN